MKRQLRKFAERQGKVYGEFGRDKCPEYDFGDVALEEFYNSESTGSPVSERNGYALGKQWAGVTADQWEKDIKDGLLHISELDKDFEGHDWFLKDIRQRIVKWNAERFAQRKSFSWGRIVEGVYRENPS